MSLHAMIAETKLRVVREFEGQKVCESWKKCRSITLYPNGRVMVFTSEEKQEWYDVSEVRLWSSYKWYFTIMFRNNQIIIVSGTWQELEYCYKDDILYVRLGSGPYCPF